MSIQFNHFDLHMRIFLLHMLIPNNKHLYLRNNCQMLYFARPPIVPSTMMCVTATFLWILSFLSRQNQHLLSPRTLMMHLWFCPRQRATITEPIAATTALGTLTEPIAATTALGIAHDYQNVHPKRIRYSSSDSNHDANASAVVYPLCCNWSAGFEPEKTIAFHGWLTNPHLIISFLS